MYRIRYANMAGNIAESIVLYAEGIKLGKTIEFL